MKGTAELKKTIMEQLRPGIRIGITTHIEPDGDGFCAALALQFFLRSRGHPSEIITDGNDLERFAFLMEGAQHTDFVPGRKYDLLFILDCNSYTRLGGRKELVDDSNFNILIDHHVPENALIEADHSHIDTESVSVGAILFNMLESEIAVLPDSLRMQIGNCLYTTVINDTNNFTNANTTEETFQISSGLAALGINPSELHRKYFLNHSPNEMRFVGETLSTIELHHHNRIMFMHSSLEMMERNQLDASSIMSITRWVQGVMGVDVIAYLREESPGYYKLSLRSPVLDVNRIAVQYGGGGHRKASGAHILGSLQSIREDILNRLIKAIEEDGPKK